MRLRIERCLERHRYRAAAWALLCSAFHDDRATNSGLFENGDADPGGAERAQIAIAQDGRTYRIPLLSRP